MFTAYVSNLEKNKFSSNDSSMIDNNLYKTTRDDNNQWQDGSVHYADIPAITTSRPQSGVYDALATPTHNVKQSDNPLYSSTQELRMSATYDSVPPRARSLTPSAISSMFPITSYTPDLGKKIEDNSMVTASHMYSSPVPGPIGNNMMNNRLSYSFELELLSNHETSQVYHQRFSQITTNSTYTEL